MFPEPVIQPSSILGTPEEKVMMGLKMPLVRVELFEIGFVLGVTEETLIEWLRRVFLKAEEINARLLREVRATQIQLDEMWNFRAGGRACVLQRLRERVSAGIESGVSAPQSVSMPSQARQTALIERLHQTFRHAVSLLVGKSRSFCKAREQMRRRVVFFHTFYNFARPHMSLRVEIPAQDRVSKGMIQPKWRQRPSAMAAGLTDHVWILRELLTAKFEPIHYQGISG